MDYMIEYWKEKESDSIEFLKHFRCTTEPIGGSTEYDDNGELVYYDAAIVAVGLEKRNIIHKAIEWLKQQDEMIGISFEEDFIERFKNAMEETK